MFVCQLTGKQSKCGEQPKKLVTHIRNKTYYRVNHKTGMRDVVGYGTEIVREALISSEHYNKLMAEGFVPQVVKEKEEKPQDHYDSYESD
jgi:hypothetical protein